MNRIYKLLRFQRNINPKMLVEYMLEDGLVFADISCEKCGENYKVYNDITRMDTCFFACTSCHVHKAIKTCLWGRTVRVPFVKILQFIIKYIENDNLEQISYILEIDQKIAKKLAAKLDKHHTNIMEALDTELSEMIKNNNSITQNYKMYDTYNDYAAFLTFDQIFLTVWKTIAYKKVKIDKER